MYIYPFFIMYIGTPCSVHLSFFHLVYWNTLYVHLSFFHLVYWDTLYVHLSFFILYIGIPCSVHLSLFHLVYWDTLQCTFIPFSSWKKHSNLSSQHFIPYFIFHKYIFIFLYNLIYGLSHSHVYIYIIFIPVHTYIYIYYSYPTYRFFRLISTHSIKTNILLKTIFIKIIYFFTIQRSTFWKGEVPYKI